MQPYYDVNNLIEVGCDEAGRGCLAGPVVASAVIFPKDYFNPLIKDSKKLSLKLRLELRAEIQKNCIAHAIGIVSHSEIDQINILNASILAMHRALDQIKEQIDLIIVDGNKFKKYKVLEHLCIIKGDDKFQSIAAASILAKTYRDDLMKEYHNLYPNYRFDKNKGYPSLLHRNAITEHGVCPIHRMTFGQNKKIQLELFK